MPLSPLNFIPEFAKFCTQSEIPARFALWTAIAGVSAVLGRRVWLPMETFTVFPNLYVLLVAGSGRFRKSTSLDQLEPLLYRLDPPINMIAQKITPQALFDAMAEGRSEKTDQKTGEVTIVHEGFAFVDEFSHFLNLQNYENGMGPMLTNCADGKRMQYQTKSRGKETIQNPCLTILAAATADFVRDAIPASAVGGGVTSRFVFVYEATPSKPVARPQKPRIDDRLFEALALIHQTTGEVTLAEDAWEYYSAQYNQWHETSPYFFNPLLQGYASRRFVHAMRVATALAVSEHPLAPPRIALKHMQAAVTLLEDIEPGMPRVLRLITSSERGALAEIVLSYLDGYPQGLAAHQLLQCVSHRIGQRDFQELLVTLIRTKEIVSESGVYRSARGASR